MSQILRNELTTDPLARGYAGVTDAAAADSLNAKNIERTRTVTDAVKGFCQYKFLAADVDTAGLYYAYFVAYEGSPGESDHFPVRSRLLLVRIDAD